MAALDNLTALIAAENPYTDGDVESMDMYVLAETANASVTVAAEKALSQIDMEMDGNYPGTWDFKGVPQKLSKVLRIKYRYKVANANLNHWRTGYLLIGFEDGGAG